MKKINPIRGTRDYFAEDSKQFENIVAVAKEASEKYGFEALHTPIFEATEVFKRAVGEETDIVNKEMYSFDTKGGENITLRPEFTAGVVRSLISNSLTQSMPQKFFSYGPVFRYERPQKGRQRQFHQINFESFGNAKPVADAEMILLAAEILQSLGIVKNVELNLNTLGDAESRKNYLTALVEYLTKYENELSEESKIRLVKNPMRILDSKAEQDKKICENAPKINEYLNSDSSEFFEELQNLLQGKLNIPLKINPEIVRGLDYYNHTVFEFISSDEEIGSQSTILAGGRYDGLVEQLGGSKVPAVGFAAGIERLMLVADMKLSSKEKYAVIADNDLQALEIATVLRDKNKICEIIHAGNFKKKLDKANKISAGFVVFGFEEGIEIKNLKTGEQKKINLEDIN